MKLNPDAFNRFAGEIGQRVFWRRAHECPSRNPDSNQHNSACRACVNGRIWETGECTHLALSGQKLQQAWASYGQSAGLFEKGDVVCSLPSDVPLYGMGEYDRVAFIDSSEPFSIAYGVLQQSVKFKFTVTKVERLFWLDPTLSNVIDGTLPVVNSDGTITFGRVAPPANTAFTITGRRVPEYFCFADYPQDRAHFGGEPLPRKVILRPFDLFSRAN
ncbi:MAG TPA: hypothetical protein VNX47_02500 [Nevskia sp.]|jgi:hypothetical protein|nr:hypothetical protein [Nevskia sp.]